MATTDSPGEMFAVDFAQLAREIAMDVFPVAQIIELHRLDEAEWQRIQKHPRFIATLDDMIREWNSAKNTMERVRIKAATGLESMLESYILAIDDESIPLTQRVEAGKFLARLGDLDGQGRAEGPAGEKFHISINIGTGVPLTREVTIPQQVMNVIEHE